MLSRLSGFDPTHYHDQAVDKYITEGHRSCAIVNHVNLSTSILQLKTFALFRKLKLIYAEIVDINESTSIHCEIFAIWLNPSSAI